MNLAPKLKLSVSERINLRHLLSSRSTPRALKLRTRAILACAKGKTNLEVGRELKVTNLTVGKWRKQFRIHRLKDFDQELRGRRVLPVTLSAWERTSLETWARSSQSSASLATRARVILECATGKSNVTVARETRLSKQTVGKLRHRFLLRRLEGLKPYRAGRPVIPVTLSLSERMTLETWSLYSSSPTLARRATVILSCAMGKANAAIASEMELSEATVGKLRRRFLEQRLAALTHGLELPITQLAEIARAPQNA
jgi:DNA-binding NarL/FixJ family response regulator